MRLIIMQMLAAFLVFLTCTGLQAAEVSDIANYRQHNPQFSSSGQPSPEQLQVLFEDGFKRIIYLAFSDNHTAIEHEDRVVKSLGMVYVHIPVDFDHPTLEDFETFASVMNGDKQMRTLLHCQINLRASSFSFLYRVIYGGVPMSEAKPDLDAIWQPDKVWFQFIVDVLEEHKFSHECDTCDWGVNEFKN